MSAGLARWAGFRLLAPRCAPHRYGKRRPPYLTPAVPAAPAGGWLSRVPLLPAPPPPINPARMLPDIDIDARDVEQRHRLYRWGWMLDATDGAFPADRLVEYMLASDERMSPQPAHPYWESYSLAERIVSAVLLAAWYRGLPAAHAIEPLLFRSGVTLLNRLEYYGARTNNHLLNDARALYMLGVVAGVRAFADAGRTILEHELPRMVPEGVLREGSSHYHLLVSRWAADVAWAAAEARDERFSEFVERLLASMTEAGELLADPTRACLTVGDVSPDITIEGLRRTMTELYARPWGPSRAPTTGVRRRGEWCRWDGSNGAAVVWRLPADPTPAHPTHAHADFGAPLLWVHGRAVLTDPGRLDYTASPLGRYGATAGAHSVLLLDGVGPVPEPAGPFTQRDLAAVNATVGVQAMPSGCRVELAHDGFRRVERGARHARVFDASAGSLRIEDRVNGRGTHDVTLLFQLAPGVDVERRSDEDWLLGAGDVPIRITCDTSDGVTVRSEARRAVDGPQPAGWMFPDYGERQPATTLRFDLRVTLPLRVVSTISWN